MWGVGWGVGGRRRAAVYLAADSECRGGGDRSGTEPGTGAPEGPEGTLTSDGSGCDGGRTYGLVSGD